MVWKLYFNKAVEYKCTIRQKKTERGKIRKANIPKFQKGKDKSIQPPGIESSAEKIGVNLIQISEASHQKSCPDDFNSVLRYLILYIS